MFQSVTCRRFWCCTPWSWGGNSRWTFNRKCSLHHQPHTDLPQRAVGVCGHITVCYQLVAISKVPDVVNGSGGFEVAAGVVQLDLKDYIITTEENIL